MARDEDELDAIWAAHRLDTLARADELIRLSRQVAAGHLDEAERLEGVRSAHMLAGSVAIFGFDEGANVAKEIEALLSTAGPEVSEPLVLRLQELADRLRLDLGRARHGASGSDGAGTLF